jgi:hypothetical protein
MPESRNLIPSIPERVYQRLLAWADRDESTGCLVSRYSVGSHGYAQVGWVDAGKRTMMLAHRAVWIYANGPIAEGMTIDHRQGVCSPKCIEITHLRELTNYENARRNRGDDFPLGQCQHGHPDSMIRTYSRSGGKTTLGCSGCRADMQRRYRARKKLRH